MSDELRSIWHALGEVADPELPLVSIVELGIVRSVERGEDGWTVTLTPTYSGCPATRVIEEDVRAALATATTAPVRIATALAPAWTTDWIAPEARRKLHAAGIVPPAAQPPAHVFASKAQALSASQLAKQHKLKHKD